MTACSESAPVNTSPFKSKVPEFPLGFALMLRNWCDLKHFVETGTYEGATTRLVAPHFSRVHTIEGVEDRFYLTATEGMPDNVMMHLGSSDELLAWVLQWLPGNCLIFLDAHWIHAGMGAEDDTFQEGLSVCPLRGELEAINMNEAHVILIDDAHFFTHPPKNRGNDDEWLSLDQICALLPNRYVFIHEGMICAVPEVYRSEVRAWLKENWRDADRIPATRRCSCDI